jgi:ABC-type glycerol-3-phosphate transport system permease component
LSTIGRSVNRVSGAFWSRPSWRIRQTIRLAPAWVLLAVVAASTLYPLLFILFTSLKSVSEFAINPLGPPSEPTLGNIQEVLSRGLLGTNVLNSLLISTLTVVVVVAISCLAGFALAFLRFRLRRTILLGIVGLLIQPTALLMIPIVLIVSNLGLISTYLGIVLVYAGLGIPFGIYLMYSYMVTVPHEIIDAARVDGASTFQVLYRVAIPVVAPALGALATLSFIGWWNEFLFALLILQDGSQQTVIVALGSLQGEHFLHVPLVAAGMLFSIIPPLTVFVILHRRLFSGLTAGALK